MPCGWLNVGGPKTGRPFGEVGSSRSFEYGAPCPYLIHERALRVTQIFPPNPEQIQHIQQLLPKCDSERKLSFQICSCSRRNHRRYPLWQNAREQNNRSVGVPISECCRFKTCNLHRKAFRTLFPGPSPSHAEFLVQTSWRAARYGPLEFSGAAVAVNKRAHVVFCVGAAPSQDHSVSGGITEDEDEDAVCMGQTLRLGFGDTGSSRLIESCNLLSIFEGVVRHECALRLA